jgi:hypothetical protein
MEADEDLRNQAFIALLERIVGSNSQPVLIRFVTLRI